MSTFPSPVGIYESAFISTVSGIDWKVSKLPYGTKLYTEQQILKYVRDVISEYKQLELFPKEEGLK